MTPDPELEYLEKLFGDAYRNEVSQEENVWRSLPFFAAALALEVTALAQVRQWVSGTDGWVWDVSTALLAAAALATFLALIFLAQSIWPARFRYVTREADLLEYVRNVRAAATEAGSDADTAKTTAVVAAKTVMIQHYALAADSNRAINRRRGGRRARAGLATLASVLAVLALVALAVLTNLDAHATNTRSSGRTGAAPRAVAHPGSASG
jgi:uncharacterized membrane protein